MPVIAASRIAAHVTSNRSALALWTMIRPRTSDAPPKYSPTIAPIRLSVVADLERREEERQRVRDPDLAQDRPLARGVRAHQLERRRLDLDEAAGDVDHDREEDEDRGHHHLRQRVLRPEPVVDQRREGDDRDRVGGDRERQEGAAGGHPAGRRERDQRRRPIVPIDEPAERLDRASPGPTAGARTGRRPVLLERGEDRRRLREDERLEVQARRRPAPRRRSRRRRRGAPAGSRAAADAPRREPPPRGRRRRPRGRARRAAGRAHPTAPSAIVRSAEASSPGRRRRVRGRRRPLPERLADRGDELEVARASRACPRSAVAAGRRR